MWRHRLPEIFFFFCRVFISYGAMVAFLAAPPVILLNQSIAQVVQPLFPDLYVEQQFSAVTKYEGTVEAFHIVWLGKESAALFTAEEVSHLIDVHRLFLFGSFLLACAVIFSILIEKDVVHHLVAKGNRVSVKVLSVTTVLSVLVFPIFFEAFHQLFFPQGNYSFSPESLLIQCFPPVFWLLNFIWLQVGVIVLLWWQAHHAVDTQI